MNNPDFVAFLQAYPSYPTTHIIDDLRKAEYARLDVGEHIYLDYTGGGLYAEAQVQRHHKLLSEHVFGNPHSSNPSSLAATQLLEHARDYVLKFFNANPAEYDVIFTANASGALKLVGELYPFAKGGHYLLTFDNHNSVNGIREFAHGRGAEVTYVPVVLPDMRVDASSSTITLGADKKARIIYLRFPRNRTSPVFNIRLNGSRKRTPQAGTFCWMPRLLPRRIILISARSNRILFHYRSIKCSAIRAASAH